MLKEEQAFDQKEIYAPFPIEVFYAIQRFPNFEGYTGGGAERHLERLISATQKKYDANYKPTLYVANRQIDTVPLEIPIIADPERTGLLSELERVNSPNKILHLSDSYVLLYNPEIYLEIAKFWQGSIIQRVTLLSRMQELSEKYKTGFQKYISAITKFVSQSPEMTADMIKLGIAAEKISEIENGVDTSAFTPVSPEVKQRLKSEIFPSINKDAKIFLAVARLTDPVKKIDLLIHEWQKTMRDQNAYLILVGGFRTEETRADSLVMNMQNHANFFQPTPDNIIFTGLQKTEEIQKIYQLSDALLAPSILEGFSNVALEAMSSGLPILARKGVSGYGKLITDRTTGLFFNSDDELGRKISQLNADNGLRDQLSEAARNKIVQEYSIESMIEKYKQLYLEVIKKTSN
jgi:glycosyltransferase involved in cell wall biosynthesis